MAQTIKTPIIGIDPGLTGAIAFIDEEANFEYVRDLPVEEFGKGKVKKRIDTKALYLFLDRWMASYYNVYVENVQPVPGRGSGVVQSGGDTGGAIRGVFASFMSEYNQVPSQVWKKHFKLGKNKDDSLELARELFPAARDCLTRKKDHNRAEALLIAKYGFDMELSLEALEETKKKYPEAMKKLSK